MKKRLAVLLGVTVLAGVLCACGSNTTSKDEVTSDVTTEVAETEEATEDSNSGETMESVYLGDWHEKTAGRGMMNVTLDGDTVVFDVIWGDSANKSFTWTFSGKVNEAGVIYYSNGFKGSVEYDEDGNETKTILTEDGEGSVEVLADGTMIWTEDGEAHEFVRD